VVQEYLEFFAAAYGIHHSARTKIVNDVLELTDLGYKRDALVDGLSRGMKQRLSIARVLVHDPKVLLLDEPAGNLDPRARIEMRELLKELRRMGKTILISSHILPELADLCNTVGIIERGELIYSGPVADIVKRAKTGTVIHVGVTTNQEQAAALISQDPSVENVAANNGFIEVSLKDGVKDFSFLPQRLIQAGFKLTLLKEEEVNLETAFMRLTKGMVQ
jgi:ABC-2 type transport system ATP-binding protein